ncbi:FtsX-like permease family protein [Calidifontibacter terrae]
MNAAVRLGAGLALRAGRARILTVAGCAALGVALLLISLDLPYALHRPGDFIARADKLAYVIVSGVLAAPVVVLVLTVSRLSSQTRDRRLATLRLLGMGRAGASTVAVVETTLLVSLGSVAGLAAWWVLRDAALRWLADRGWTKAVPVAHDSWALLSTIGLVAVAAACSVLPALRATQSALADARTVRAGRLLWWPLLVVAAGLVVGLVGTAHQKTQHQDERSVLPLAICFFACLVGLMLSGSALSALIGRLVRRLPGATALITGRRMEADRAATSRALAGLVLATFAASFGLSVFTIFTTTPQYREAEWAMQHVRISNQQAVSGSSVSAMLEQARRTPGVTAASAGWSPQDTSATPAAVISCAQLRLIAEVTGCRDDAPWVARSDRSRSRSLPTTTLHGHTVRAASNGTARFDDVTAGGYGPTWTSWSTDPVIVPPSVMERLRVASDAVILTLAPGTRLDGSGVLFDGEDWGNYDDVAVYRTMTYTLIAFVMAVGLLAVVVNVLDRAGERRRAVTVIRVVGTPSAILRRAQFVGVLLPLVAAVSIATLAGSVTGHTYLSFGDAIGSFPTVGLMVLWVCALLGALLVAALTLPGLGRAMTAEHLRRE